MSSETRPSDATGGGAKPRRKTLVISMAVLCPLMLSPLLVRGWFLRGVPEVPEPFDPQPLLEYSVPDEKNAFTDYREAMRLFQPPSTEVDDKCYQVLDHGWRFADDELRQFLQDSDDALRTWKRGSEQDRSLFLPASEYDVRAEIHVTDLRKIHQTALVRCRQLEAEGQPQEAWEWYRAAVRSSRHIGRHGVLLERLLGAYGFQLSSVHLERWAADPRLTSDDLKLAVRQLQADWKLTEKPSTTLKLEYLAFQKTLKQLENGELSDSIFGRLDAAPTVQDELIDLTTEYELIRRLCRI